MTNDKNKSEVRSLGGLLLQMKLDENPEMRIIAEELIVNKFEDIEKELAQEKELSLQFDNKYWAEVALHEKTKAELAAANEKLEIAKEALGFYANKDNWLRDPDGWRHDMIVRDLDDESLKDWEGRFSGMCARAALKKLEEKK